MPWFAVYVEEKQECCPQDQRWQIWALFLTVVFGVCAGLAGARTQLQNADYTLKFLPSVELCRNPEFDCQKINETSVFDGIVVNWSATLTIGKIVLAAFGGQLGLVCLTIVVLFVSTFCHSLCRCFGSNVCNWDFKYCFLAMFSIGIVLFATFLGCQAYLAAESDGPVKRLQLTVQFVGVIASVVGALTSALGTFLSIRSLRQT